MDQPDLFPVGERDVHGINARDSLGRRKHPLTTCTPAAIGTGPKERTCGSCKHAVRFVQSKRWIKCGLMRKWWTHGTGTDIKARWPACGRWESEDHSEDKEA